MELIWSTATFKPLKSTTSSASLVAFSNAIWYWKPEQPPPTTATRNATGTGVCMLMISLTFVLATGVKLIIILRPPLAAVRRDANYSNSIAKDDSSCSLTGYQEATAAGRSFDKLRRLAYNKMPL